MAKSALAVTACNCPSPRALDFNMVAKPGFTPGHSHQEVSDWQGHFNCSGQNFNTKMNLHDSVFNVTWSNFLRDAWAPTQTPVLLVTRWLRGTPVTP